MVSFIRQQGLKFQMVFWLSLIAIGSFSVLFGFNYWFYRSRLVNSQWQQVQAAAELASMSTMFESMDAFIDSGTDPSGDIETLFEFTTDLIEKSGIDGAYFFYQKDGDVYQITSLTEYKTLLSDNPDVPALVNEGVKKVFYTGTFEKCTAIRNDENVYYFIQPLVETTKYKYGICTYLNSMSIELLLLRFVVVNILSFVFVMICLVFLIILAADRVLIRPIIEIEKIIDSFVYQVSGGYHTNAFIQFHGNEITTLKKSVNRLEGMVKNHNKLVEESSRYREFFKNRSESELQMKIDYLVQAEKLNALCDKETMTGNIISWGIKKQEIDHLLREETIDFLYMVYLRFPSKDVDLQSFLDDVMTQVGIKGIPLDTIFRISDTDFVCIFGRKRLMDAIKSYVDDADTHVKCGCVALIPEVHHSAQELIDVCLKQIDSKESEETKHEEKE